MAGNDSYRVCKRCVMDSSVRGIHFDQNGVCNYCHDFDTHIDSFRFSDAGSEKRLASLVKKIKDAAKGKEYDSIVGLSGGVDSSYVAFLAHKLGLKPLAIHFDNGWNSEIAVSNIKKIVNKCGFDLETYVIHWPEFRDLQRSFLKASVIDIEMVTDHAIFAAMFHYAKKYKIKYVLSGTNFTTEHGMPNGWTWRKSDIINIRDIQHRFGTLKIKSYPTMGSLEFALIRKLEIPFGYIELLNAVNYRKNDAMTVLKNEFNWEYYGGKHYESVFTKFYQGYILPKKFGIDKRMVHWSALVRNGEMTREEACKEIARPIYTDVELQADKEYVCKKLEFSEQEFNDIMDDSPREHLFYKSDQRYLDIYTQLYKILKKSIRS